MSISEAVLDYRKSSNLSQGDIAKQVNVDRTLITKAENGMKLAEHHDAALSKVNWRITLAVLDERTGGYISNILDEQPNLDLHPSALKEILMKDMQEAMDALKKVQTAQHADIEKQRKNIERTWHEVMDVIEIGLIIEGVFEELYGLDRDKLTKTHDMQRKKGER
jgi:transcriptional regulator with XRE-family HTH domain